MKKGNKYYGNLNVWNNPQLSKYINNSKNLTNLQKNALRRMIRSVKLNKKYPGQTRNSSRNRMELTNELLKNSPNNAALAKRIKAASNSQQRRTNENTKGREAPKNVYYNTQETLPTYQNHLRNSGNY